MIRRYEGRSVDEIASLAAQYPEWSRASETYRHRRGQFEIELLKLGDGSIWMNGHPNASNANEPSVKQHKHAADDNREIGRIQTKSTAQCDRIRSRTHSIASKKRAMNSFPNATTISEVQSANWWLKRFAMSQGMRTCQALQSAPRSFLKAFTKGRYALRMGSGRTPEFTAWDTHISREQPLDQLSGGTRVQLLIAVRMAFIERFEAEACLPVIFDETLANADDIRADALIDATLQIAADGRQVFYFTAQLDEVDKWRSRAAGAKCRSQWLTLRKHASKRIARDVPRSHFRR
ncbi:MAG: hypothetical protein R2845_15055 [Thermomicrobiales bacterium]